MHCRGARNHAQRADLREICDQRFGESVREIFLLWIARKIFERQHNNRLDGVLRLALQGLQEAIAAARQSFDELRMIGGIAKRFANLIDGGIEAIVEIHEGVGGPQFPPQIVAGDDLAGNFQQFGENLKRLIL